MSYNDDENRHHDNLFDSDGSREDESSSQYNRSSSSRKAIPLDRHSDLGTERVELIHELKERMNRIESRFNPKRVNDDDLREKYVGLYNETNIVLDELLSLKQSNRKWRRRTWVWRIVSFVLGSAFGFVIHAL